MNNATAYLDESAAGWERSIYAFLAEKERRSGSMRTVQSYSRMLNDFFGRAHKTPNEVTAQDVFAWALRQRPIGQDARLDHYRRQDRLPQQLLPLSHPHERCRGQPMRCYRATEGCSELASRPQRRPDPTPPRGAALDAGGPP